MTIQEIFDYVFVTSNQSFIGVEAFEAKGKVFETLVKKALILYSTKKTY